MQCTNDNVTFPITSVSATDEDRTPEYNTIHFVLVGNSSAYFSIDAFNGTLYRRRAFDVSRLSAGFNLTVSVSTYLLISNFSLGYLSHAHDA